MTADTCPAALVHVALAIQPVEASRVRNRCLNRDRVAYRDPLRVASSVIEKLPHRSGKSCVPSSGMPLLPMKPVALDSILMLLHQLEKGTITKVSITVSSEKWSNGFSPRPELRRLNENILFVRPAPI